MARQARRKRIAALCSASLLVAIYVVPAAKGASSDVPADGGLTSMEIELVREVNLARSDPLRYASFLEQWRRFYENKKIRRSGELSILTEEGVAAVEEAIAFLRASSRRPALRLSAGMSRGAKDHARQLGAAGALGHRGLHGNWPTDRVNRYGRWRDAMGENIFYGRGTAREMVMLLIIDDGIPGRDHRRTTFDPVYGVIGAGCAPHTTYDTICVLTFAGDYEDM